MAKKQVRGERSQAVRDHLQENPDQSPNQVVEALAKKGITVSTGLVSVIKYKKARKSRVIKKAKTKGVDLKQLIALKKLADEMGGMDQLKSAMDALEQLR